MRERGSERDTHRETQRGHRDRERHRETETERERERKLAANE